MTNPIVLTDEIRQAVHDEDCELGGHMLSLTNATAWEPSQAPGAKINAGAARVQGPAGQLPHVRCARCNKVWILVPDAQVGYDAAQEAFRGHLKPDDPLAVAIDLVAELPVVP